jgi:hypothetical protein
MWYTIGEDKMKKKKIEKQKYCCVMDMVLHLSDDAKTVRDMAEILWEQNQKLNRRPIK